MTALCGSDSYREDPLAMNWPRGACTLPPGHESDHQFCISPGDVWFQWPYTRAELLELAR